MKEIELKFLNVDKKILIKKIEIEGEKESDISRICKKLGLDIKDGKNKTIIELYPRKFN